MNEVIFVKFGHDIIAQANLVDMAIERNENLLTSDYELLSEDQRETQYKALQKAWNELKKQLEDGLTVH